MTLLNANECFLICILILYALWLIMTHDIYVLENIANGMLMNSDYNTGYKCSDLQLFVYGK